MVVALTRDDLKSHDVTHKALNDGDDDDDDVISLLHSHLSIYLPNLLPSFASTIIHYHPLTQQRDLNTSWYIAVINKLKLFGLRVCVVVDTPQKLRLHSNKSTPAMVIYSNNTCGKIISPKGLTGR